MMFLVDTVTHVIFGKEVRIHDVPHYRCTGCKRSTYDKAEVVVSKMLREAYLDNISDVKFQII